MTKLLTPASLLAPGGKGTIAWRVVLLLLPILVVVLATKNLNATIVSTLATVAIFALVVVSLNIVAGYTGQFSLGQMGFCCVGAYGMAVGTVKLNLSPLLALLLGIAASLVAAAIIGSASFRTRGFYFSVVTLGFSLVITSIAEGSTFTGGSSGLVGVPAINLGFVKLLTPSSIAIAGVVVYVVLAIYIRQLLASREGSAMRAISADEVMATALGINPFRVKMKALCLSAAIASLAGSLYAVFLQIVVPDEFTTAVTIQTLVMFFLGGAGTLVGPLVGACVLLLQLSYSSAGTSSELIDGIVLAAVLLVLPNGVVGTLIALTRRLRRRFDLDADDDATVRRRSDVQTGQSRSALGGQTTRELSAVNSSGGESAGPPRFQVVGLDHRFGGLHAVREVSFEIGAGEIVAIIGPNGAGKTTLVNLMSGQIPTQRGSIYLDGDDITRVAPWQRAHAGVSRTFQIPKLWMEGTVLDNVMTGAYLHRRGGYGSAAVRPMTLRKDRERAAAEAIDRLAFVGLREVADRRITELTSGQVHLVEIARCLMQNPRVLLLDEPAGGFIDAERSWLADIIQKIRATGVSVCIIEHNMDLVLAVADRITVVNFGSVLAHGRPVDVMNDPAVREAYLGTERSHA